jgi:hypothetical protein
MRRHENRDIQEELLVAEKHFSGRRADVAVAAVEFNPNASTRKASWHIHLLLLIIQNSNPIASAIFATAEHDSHEERALDLLC